MVEKGWPWDSSVDDERRYGAQEIADAFSSFVKNGVLDAEGDFLLTPQSGNTLRISGGTAWINGRILKLDGFEDITIPYAAEAATPQYGILGLRLRPDVDHRDFTFFYAMPNGSDLPTLGQNEIGIAKIRYDRGTPAIANNHIVRDVERAYTTNPYYDKKGITMEFLNEVVSSDIEFSPDGIALYNGGIQIWDKPKADATKKKLLEYDNISNTLKIVGEVSTNHYVSDIWSIFASLKKFNFNGLDLIGLEITNDGDNKMVAGMSKPSSQQSGYGVLGITGLMNIMALDDGTGGSVVNITAEANNSRVIQPGITLTAIQSSSNVIISGERVYIKSDPDKFRWVNSTNASDTAKILTDKNSKANEIRFTPKVSCQGNQCYYMKDTVTDIVHVNLAASAMSIANETIVFTLPTGYRPSGLVYAGYSSSGSTALYGYISTSGDIHVKNALTSSSPDTWTFLQWTFVAAN